MALFPMDIDEPVWRRRRQTGHGSPFLATGGLALSLVYFWAPLAVLAAHDRLPPRELVGLALAVLMLVVLLQNFLAYRLLAQVRACPVVTDPADAFLYGSRLGSGVLLSLCIPWCVVGVYGLVMSLLAAVEMVGPHRDPDTSRPLGLLSAFIMLTTPLALLAGIWWASRTGVRALYRVLGADAGRDDYEGVPLGLDEPGLKSNMQRSRGVIFGLVPSPSWLRW